MTNMTNSVGRLILTIICPNLDKSGIMRIFFGLLVIRFHIFFQFLLETFKHCNLVHPVCQFFLWRENCVIWVCCRKMSKLLTHSHFKVCNLPVYGRKQSNSLSYKLQNCVLMLLFPMIWMIISSSHNTTFLHFMCSLSFKHLLSVFVHSSITLNAFMKFS